MAKDWARQKWEIKPEAVSAEKVKRARRDNIIITICIAVPVLAALVIWMCVELAPDNMLRRRLSEYGPGDTVNLTEIAPFEWDTMYCFTPSFYIDEVVSDYLGFECEFSAWNDRTPLIIFSKDAEFVCSINSDYYFKSAWFHIDRDLLESERCIVISKDNPVFIIDEWGQFVPKHYEIYKND